MQTQRGLDIEGSDAETPKSLCTSCVQRKMAFFCFLSGVIVVCLARQFRVVARRKIKGGKLHVHA